MEENDNHVIRKLWGNSSFQFAFSALVGNLGGILAIWCPSVFVKQQVSCFDYFLILKGCGNLQILRLCWFWFMLLKIFEKNACFRVIYLIFFLDEMVK